MRMDQQCVAGVTKYPISATVNKNSDKNERTIRYQN